MDWVLVVFVLFKAIVFDTGMYFAVKWHDDQEKTKAGGQALLRVGTKVVALFLLLLLVLLALTFGLSRMLGMDLRLS